MKQLMQSTGEHIEFFEIVGFDFGHGETALAKTTSIAGGAEPEMLDIHGRKTQITALGISAHLPHENHIGEDAFESPDVCDLHLGFKPKRHNLDDPQPEHQRIIRRFIGTYVDVLRATKQLQDANQTLFIVGMPSGWSQKEQQEYRCILQEAGLSRLRVEKESRGAFLHIKESKAFDVHATQLLQSILIIDVGSSTTDFTLVSNLEAQSLEDFGEEIGAGLIDDLIFQRTLQRMEADDPDEKARLDVIFEQEPHWQRRCLLNCRRGKEIYFSKPANYISELHCVECSRKIRAVRPAIEFDPLIYTDEMEKVLNTPLPELGKRGWKTAFCETLREAKAKIGPKPPDLLILTGGASKMPFVLDLCQDVFLQTPLFVRGPEPEFTIAKGLARIGRIDFLTEQLKQRIAKLGESQALRDLLDDNLPPLIDRLADSLVEDLVSVAIRPALLDWQSGRVRTLNDIPTAIMTHKTTYADHVRRQAQGVVKAWFDGDLLPGLMDFTEPICREFDIPRAALDLHDEYFVAGDDAITHLPVTTHGIVERNGFEGIVIAVTGVVSGMVSGGAGVALLGLPLVGQILAGMLAAMLAAFGVKATEKKITSMNIYHPLRKIALSERKIEKMLCGQQAQLRESITNQLTGEPLWIHELKEIILRELKRALNEQVNRAVLWIR